MQAETAPRGLLSPGQGDGQAWAHWACGGTVTLTPLTLPGRGLLLGARIYKAPPAQDAENSPFPQLGVALTGRGCSPNLEGG